MQGPRLTPSWGSVPVQDCRSLWPVDPGGPQRPLDGGAKTRRVGAVADG